MKDKGLLTAFGVIILYWSFVIISVLFSLAVMVGIISFIVFAVTHWLR